MIDLSFLSHQWIWAWIVVCLVILLVGVYAHDLTVSVLPITAITFYLSYKGILAGWIWIVGSLIVAVLFIGIMLKKFLYTGGGSGGGQNVNM